MKGSGPPSSAQPAFVACLQSRTKATCRPSGLGLCCGGKGDLNSGACPAPISGNPDPAGQRVRALVTRCSQHFLQGTIRTDLLSRLRATVVAADPPGYPRNASTSSLFSLRSQNSETLPSLKWQTNASFESRLSSPRL